MIVELARYGNRRKEAYSACLKDVVDFSIPSNSSLCKCSFVNGRVYWIAEFLHRDVAQEAKAEEN